MIPNDTFCQCVLWENLKDYVHALLGPLNVHYLLTQFYRIPQKMWIGIIWILNIVKCTTIKHFLLWTDAIFLVMYKAQVHFLQKTNLYSLYSFVVKVCAKLQC